MSYIETQHASDEARLYTNSKNDEARNACLTLNMLKIKQTSQGTYSRNNDINEISCKNEPGCGYL